MVDENERNDVFGHYMNKLRMSGYNYNYRVMSFKGIVEKIKEFEEMVAKGEKTRCRIRMEIREDKSKREGWFTDNCFVRGSTTQILMIQYTKGGGLRKFLGTN